MSALDDGAVRPLARRIALLPLVGIIFFSVSGGAYGLEPLVSASGPGLALLLIFLVPLFYGAPIAAIASELATALPVEGGTYEWARRSMGSFMGFQAGFLRWVNSWVDMAVYPVLFASYFSTLLSSVGVANVVFFSFGPFQLDLNWMLGVVCVIIPMGILNVRGAKSVGDSAVLFTVIALLPLLLISVIGIWHLFQTGTNPFVPFTPPGTSMASAIGVGLSFVMWSYCGFDQVGLIAGEIKEPSRNIPKAMIASMIVIILSYALPLLGSLSVPGWQKWEAGSFADVANALAGPWLQILVTIGGMFCAIGLYSSLLMSSTRGPFVLSRDRFLTPKLAIQTKKTGSPIVSIIVCSVIYAFFSLGSFTALIGIDVFLINLLLLVNLVALIILRVKEPNLPRPVRLPFGWFGIALVGVPLIVSIMYLMYLQYESYGLTAFLVFVGTLGLSALAYIPARRYQRKHQLETPNHDPIASDAVVNG